MKNKPNFIFLQMGLEEENSVEDFNNLEHDFITWEDHQIYSDDLQFISIDFILARIKELETEYHSESSIPIRMNIASKIEELKNLLK